MKSPASVALAALGAVALICATVFYDRPLTNNNQLFSYLRSFALIPANNATPIYIAHARSRTIVSSSETIIDPSTEPTREKDKHYARSLDCR